MPGYNRISVVVYIHDILIAWGNAKKFVVLKLPYIVIIYNKLVEI